MRNRWVLGLLAAGAAGCIAASNVVPAARADEIQVNTFTKLNQWLPSIGRLDDGGFVVVWQSDFQRRKPKDFVGDIYGQRFDRQGAKLGAEFPVNTVALGAQALPALAVLADGSFVVVWVSNHENPLGNIEGQHFAADGQMLGAEFRVNLANAGANDAPHIGALADGGYVVVWASSPDGSSEDTFDIAGQRFSATGDRMGGQFLVNRSTAGAQLRSQVTGTADGGFIAVWDSAEDDGNGATVYLIRGQRYAADGSRLGRAFTVVRHRYDTRRPRLATLGSGGFVVIWESRNNREFVYQAFAQLYSDAGDKIGDAIQVAPGDSNQFNPNVGARAGGGFVVAWADEFANILAQRFADDGSPNGDVFRINDKSDKIRDWPVFAPSGRHGFVVAWDAQDGSGLGVFARKFRR
jgi:hypothetical protein